MRDARYGMWDMRYVPYGAFFGGAFKSAGIINCHLIATFNFKWICKLLLILKLKKYLCGLQILVYLNMIIVSLEKFEILGLKIRVSPVSR